MSVRQARLWDAIKILPEKWQQHPYGEQGAGFWAVGLMGHVVVWYNDIEEGFNRSRYASYGTIGDYWCNQDELEMTVQQLLTIIETGEDTSTFLGPPQPVS